MKKNSCVSTSTMNSTVPGRGGGGEGRRGREEEGFVGGWVGKGEGFVGGWVGG